MSMEVSVQQTSSLMNTQGRLRRQTLMIDADDTLWENNIYFERAISRFIDLVAHPELSRAEVREAFDRLEASRVKEHGYGTGAFHRSLLAGFEHLTGSACDAGQQDQVHAIAHSICASELTLLHGVVSTLQELAQRHQLILVTKGDDTEQRDKLASSGLGIYFSHVEVLREKHKEAYTALLAKHTSDPMQTWMVGNSPRSDVNPALAAGLHAVYIAHPSTWVLEQEALSEPRNGRRLLHLSTFADLLLHF